MAASAVAAAAAAAAGAEADAPVVDEAPVIHLKMQNIMASVNMGTRLDLDKITQTARNAEYNPKRFQAVIMRIRDPRTTALIFASGKMIVTGARSEEAASIAAKKYVAIIQKVGFPARFEEFKVQNMTASCDAGFPIRLEGLAFAHPAQSTYEPELFPGLVYRLAEPKCVLLIFVSGKCVLTGSKSINALTAAFEKVFPQLLEFRKKNLVVLGGMQQGQGQGQGQGRGRGQAAAAGGGKSSGAKGASASAAAAAAAAASASSTASTAAAPKATARRGKRKARAYEEGNDDDEDADAGMDDEDD